MIRIIRLSLLQKRYRDKYGIHIEINNDGSCSFNQFNECQVKMLNRGEDIIMISKPINLDKTKYIVLKKNANGEIINNAEDGIKIKQPIILKEHKSFKEINGVVIEDGLLNNVLDNSDIFNKMQLTKLNKNKCMDEIKNKNKKIDQVNTINEFI